MDKKRMVWKKTEIISISINVLSLFTAVCAAYAAYSSAQSAKYQLQTLRPYLAIAPMLAADSGIFISNEGLSPAVIESITINGKKYSSFTTANWHQLLQDAQLQKCNYLLIFGSINRGTVIRANSTEEPLIALSKANMTDIDCIKFLLRFIHESDIQITYYSIYDENGRKFASEKLKIY